MKRAAVIVGVWALFTLAWIAVVVVFDLSDLAAGLGGFVVGFVGCTAGRLCADEWVGYR